MPDAIPDLIPALEPLVGRHFQRIVVFSGAGLSAESGIPTFRSGHNGLWSAFDPAELASPQGWHRHRALVWAWYEWRRGLVAQAQPHAGHHAAVALQRELGAVLITQNVDDLLERAGAQDVVHLHGSLMAPRCDTCGRACTLPVPLAQPPLRELDPPACAHCAGHIRPGVVWFGESLPEAALTAARQAIEAADLLVIVGTSSVVYPAAGLVDLAGPGCLLLEINPEPVRQRRPGHMLCSATAAQALPVLAQALGLRRSGA